MARIGAEVARDAKRRAVTASSLVILLFASGCSAAGSGPQPAGPEPILDVQLHASERKVDWGVCISWIAQVPVRAPTHTWQQAWDAVVAKPPCPDPIWPAADAQQVMERTLAVMVRRNIIGVVSGGAEPVPPLASAAPDRVIPALQFNVASAGVSTDSVRRLLAGRSFGVLGEVTNQYAGIAPDD